MLYAYILSFFCIFLRHAMNLRESVYAYVRTAQVPEISKGRVPRIVSISFNLLNDDLKQESKRTTEPIGLLTLGR